MEEGDKDVKGFKMEFLFSDCELSAPSKANVSFKSLY